MWEADAPEIGPDSLSQEKELAMATGSRSGGNWKQGPREAPTAALLEELRQPIAAASNYIGAARLVLSSNDEEFCKSAIEQLARAEQQLLRAGEIIGRIYAGSKGAEGTRLS
jgi:hypothetical protein